MSKTVAEKALTKTVVLSKKNTVVLRELTALDSLAVDDYVGESVSANRAYKTYAVCSIAEFNGDKQNPVGNEVDFRFILERLTVSELGKLVKAYIEFAGELSEAHDPKDSPGAQE